MTRNIKAKGKLLTLVGRTLKEQRVSPDFRVVANDMNEVNFWDYKDKIKIVTSFPSLDTPVCDLQVKRFNQQASSISSEVVILGISKDLPFAQRRFCDVNNIKNLEVLSDYKYSSFGINYGFLVKETGLLARTVAIVDKNNVVRYIQIVDDLSNAPDYDAVLKNLDSVLKNPALPVETKVQNHCIPCEVGTPPLDKNSVEKLILEHSTWQLVDDKKIVKEFKFKDFIEAKYFFDLISVIAEDQGHHPTFTLIYNKLKVSLTTHAAGGLTNNDFIMAGIIDEV